MTFAEARLEPDGGAAAAEEQFFRSPDFLGAEGVTHTVRIERGGDRVAIPVVVRDIEGAEGACDAVSPYGYPGGRIEGSPIEPEAIDWSAAREQGLVSVFVRDRLGRATALASATDRSVVLVSDPARERKSRMSDRQQIRKNEAAGYEVSSLPGPATGEEHRREFHRVYTETMIAVDAAERYRFDRAYFDRLFGSTQSRMFSITAPEGDVAASAIAVISDDVMHYYLSGTADEHRRRAPSKNLISAVIDYAADRDLPMNLGGGIAPGDGLEEFKRGFANRELPFRTHELICDPDRYEELSAGREDRGFFPLYRAPAEPA